ncbi:hypothetical protein, partial [Enterococcus durans]|uniref:hypothetical protein n=1 Tax=Enterococcus durans TaxID=53345 RepID=UPI003219EC23
PHSFLKFQKNLTFGRRLFERGWDRSSFLEEVKILKNLKKQFSWIFSCSFRHPTFVTLIF